VEHRQALENVESVDMTMLAREAVEAVEPRLGGKRLRIACAPGAEPSMVLGDRFLLGQALANLLDNAVDFSPPDGVIRLNLRLEGRSVLLEVSDEGPGIPEFANGRVFERFYSLPRPDGSRSSGLGLSFVREVAALHGGSVRLINRDGGGAVATLSLPGR
jgi:two-component system sensor histidine kinase CreC